MGIHKLNEMNHFGRLPLTVQSVYSDLLARLREDSVLELGGTPVLRNRGGRKYWYAVQRLAGHNIEKYLGPDTTEVRRRVNRAQQINEDLKKREKQRSRLVRMCREGGLPRTDAQTGKILLALSKAGIFRLRGVLVGTHAFRCYPGLLGVEMPEANAATEDIDVAAFHSISVALDDSLEPDLLKALHQVGPFIGRPSLHRQPTAWRDHQSGMLVELLTPMEGPDRDEPLELPALGAHALPLRFLDYLIFQPTQAVALYRSGVLVNVPQPAHYAIHKIIVATRRHASSRDKARKDIEQAAALIRVLAEDRPDELEDAFNEAYDRGPSWRRHIDSGMRRLPKDARETLMDVVERFESGNIAIREELSSLPDTIGGLIEALEDLQAEADIEGWAEALGATTNCANCPTTIISPFSFASAAIEHYQDAGSDVEDAHTRIEAALRASGVETGGWGEGALCAYHHDLSAKDD